MKREREFQYTPGIEKIIEDVIGGGTIDRKSISVALFDGKPLDELPPLVIVVKDAETGLYHVVKTAAIVEAAGDSDTSYKVAKNHLFAAGDFVTLGGDMKGASDRIASIDKSGTDFDVITLDGTIGSAQPLQVMVAAKDKQSAGSAALEHDGELVITMNKVDLTVANQLSGLLVRGTVNERCMPFPIDSGLKSRMPHIRFT